jgi:hypothetical protein
VLVQEMDKKECECLLEKANNLYQNLSEKRLKNAK